MSAPSASTAGPRRSLLAGLPSALLFVPLLGCGSSSSDSSFEVRAAGKAATPSAAIVVHGLWVVYFASEAFNGPTGTNLNSDADKIDSVAFVVNSSSNVETNLGIAATGAAVIGDEVYLVVDESADGLDWDGDAVLDDRVLVHWSQAVPTPVFVDLLDAGTQLVVVPGTNDRLFYTSAGGPLGVLDETALRVIDESDSTLTPQAVLAPSGGFLRGGSPPVVRPLRESDGLLECVLDETEDGVNYNGDADATDQAVLVLLDATDPLARLANTELAMADEDEPVDVFLQGTKHWLVAFLVDETAQGATNLNDAALFPPDSLLPIFCAGVSDVDTLDRVLHYWDFEPLVGTSTPVNTGLAGHDRVLALDGFVATVSAEDDADCNLNRGNTITDTDTNDDVLRWIAATPGATPARDPDDLHALATAIGGGSFGVSVLDDRFVAVIDETADTRNLDFKAADHDLVAWLDPSVSNPTWVFAHQSGSPSIGTGVFDSQGHSEPFAGTSWMAPEAVEGRLALVFLEEVPGTNPLIGSLNTNLDCNFVPKDSDKVDGLPVWADFESGPTLDFDGMGYAVDKLNAGIVIAKGFVFFRVSELDDNRDYDTDPAKNVVLFRNPQTACAPVFMGTASSLIRPVIATDRVNTAAFLSAGIDFDGDGNKSDPVVRFFRF